jgi:hypothetical protein
MRTRKEIQSEIKGKIDEMINKGAFSTPTAQMYFQDGMFEVLLDIRDLLIEIKDKVEEKETGTYTWRSPG